MINKPKPFVRAVSLGIIRRNDGTILMERGFDLVTDETYWRIPGGGVEFMEPGSDALKREFREEMTLELSDIHFLGVVENLFHLNAAPGHEIMLIYRAQLQDATAYNQDVFRIREQQYNDAEAHWIDYRQALAKGERVYPGAAIERGWFDEV